MTILRFVSMAWLCVAGQVWAAELTLPSPPIKWFAAGGGWTSAPHSKSRHWEFEIATERNDLLYQIHMREMVNIGYILPCSGELVNCRHNLGYGDLTFAMGRGWHSAHQLRTLTAGIGLVVGNQQDNTGYQQVVTGGLSIEGRWWWTLYDHIAVGLGAYGMLKGLLGPWNQYAPYLGASLTLGVGRFQHARTEPLVGETER